MFKRCLSHPETFPQLENPQVCLLSCLNHRTNSVSLVASRRQGKWMVPSWRHQWRSFIFIYQADGLKRYKCLYFVVISRSESGWNYLIMKEDLYTMVRDTRGQFDGLVQERRNSIANAPEFCLSCTSPSILLPWIYFSPMSDKRSNALTAYLD